MRIVVTSIPVDDQGRALDFYTRVLGFRKRQDIPLGTHRWLTVVSPEDPEGVELLLEPDAHPATRAYKEALVADGVPWTSFAVKDLGAEHQRLESLGVRFTQPPTEMGPVKLAVLEDGCGNLIQLAERG